MSAASRPMAARMQPCPHSALPNRPSLLRLPRIPNAPYGYPAQTIVYPMADIKQK